MMRIFFIFLFSFNAVAGFCQAVIKGKITDKTDEEPLGYAVVRTGKNGPAVMSDRLGHFRLTMPAGSRSITISLIGYRSQTVEIDPKAGTLSVSMERGMVDLKTVTITQQTNNAAFHTISAIDLNLRPVNSSQDLMRLVPGLFLGQHHGGGIAEHIFFRGFDADHGTDVNVSVDEMPLNLVSQIHGQGFSDMHFLIPELVKNYEFGKGPYYGDRGDFTTAGYVGFHTADALEKSVVKIEGGQFQTGRVMTALNLLSDKARQRGETVYIAGEAAYTNGAFDFPQRFSRLNLFGKYNVNLSAANRLTITASTFTSKWRSSGGIPERGVKNGTVGRFGYIDSLQGGNTARTNLIAKLVTSFSDRITMDNQVYYSRYHFDHHYNDTFFAEDSVNGDRLKQHEDRDIWGYNGRLTQHRFFAGNTELTSSAGLTGQLNKVHNSELSHTDARYQVLENLKLGDIDEMSAGAFVDEDLRTGKWLFNAGLRLDYFHFAYEDKLERSMASRNKAIVSPKFNVEYTVNPNVQVYLKTGKGFHSNDARVVVGNLGKDILPAAYGTDLGVNWKPADRLFLNAALWYLYLKQEFVYDGDEGELEPSDKTRRQGIDLSARYQFTNWLFGVLDINLSKARDIQAAKGSNYIPLAAPVTSTGGLDFRFADGFNGGISYRYMKDRPANEDNSLIAKGYFVNDLTAYYTRRKFEVGLEVQNLFNVKWREEQFEATSRLKGEAAPVDDVNFTAGTSFFAKLKLAVFF